MGRIVEPQHLWRRHHVDELGLIVDGADYYRELYRAALTARRWLLFTGWQFDSEVELLRGSDALAAHAPVNLLGFLTWLCETRRSLRVCILAWDFNLIFAADREWMQALVFKWATHERVSFLFDAHHVELATLHQKYVVVDDEVAFTGGLDVCDHRWDDRRHSWVNPLRLSRGEPHQPFHDLQLYVKSREVVASLKELFQSRWVRAGGEPLPGLLQPSPTPSSYRALRALPLAAREVAVSRTDPFSMPEGKRPAGEIFELYRAAIAAAERLIYIETQYLSSKAITDALLSRMQAAGRPPLQLVFVLNMRGETLKEQATVGLAQAQNIGRLKGAVKGTAHALGIYFTLPLCQTEAERPECGTYIHSKLMIIDDLLLTVGSANLTNRSMGFDTELNVTVEAQGPGDGLAASIRAVRVDLLAEHTGGAVPRGELESIDGLVDQLEGAVGADGDRRRLRRHPSPTPSEQAALAVVDPDKLPFDPDHVEGLDEEGTLGLFNALTRYARELLSSARSD
jgi:phosphatidylserine/phosphatidylglycerophosphate/cardiolipin synthase-like enzyme